MAKKEKEWNPYTHEYPRREFSEAYKKSYSDVDRLIRDLNKGDLSNWLEPEPRF